MAENANALSSCCALVQLRIEVKICILRSEYLKITHQNLSNGISVNTVLLQSSHINVGTSVNIALLTCAQEQLKTRKNALQAVREGSQAETSMAAAARKKAEAAAAAASEAAEQLRINLAAAEERVEAALQEGRRKQEASQQR